MDNLTQPSAGFNVSNLALLAVISILAFAILMDGKLYNTPQVQNSIYPVDDAQSVEVYFADELVLAFTKANDHWRQSRPVAAPVQQQRVQVLLDTNKASSRRYNVKDLPAEDIFRDPFTLKIDSASFQFGTTEPVGNLRYIKAGDQVYLQPDKVLPLLSAANNAFIDLVITDKVQRVTIGDTPLQHAEQWSHLTAISVTSEAPVSKKSPGIEITLSQNRQTLKLTAKHTHAGYTVSNENGFHYLLDTTTAEALGLADLLLLNKPVSN